MEKSETIGKLTEALAKAQLSYLPVKRIAKVDFTTRSGQKIKYSYAPLSEILDACRKALSDNGLAVMQPTKIVDGKLIVETLLSHSSGEWVKGELLIESQDKTPQSEGSALTYARRYSLSSMLGISSEEDDDAERTMPKEPIKPVPPPTGEVETPSEGGTEATKVTPPPTTIQELLQWAIKHGKTYTRTWIVNKCKISEQRMKDEPEACYLEIKALMGWTD